MIRRAALSQLEVFLVPAVIVALFFVTTGVFFDASDDMVISLFLRGEIGGVVIDDFPRFYFLLDKFLSALYAFFPQIPWMGVLLLVVNYLVAVGILAVFNHLLSKSYKAEVVITYLVFIVLTMAENLMYYNMNRVSILACGVGFYLILQGPKIGLGWILFFLGMCVRPYGGLLAAAVILPAVFIFDQKRSLGKYVIVILCFLAVYIGFTKGFNTFDDEIAKKNKLKSNVLDFGLEGSVALVQKDSLMIEAIHSGYYSDDKITNEFLKTLGGASRWSLSNITINKVSRFFSELWYSISRNYQLILVLNLLILLLLRKRKAWWYSIYVWLVLIALGLLLKLPEKLLSPSLLLWSLILTAVLCQNWKKVTPLLRSISLIFLVLYGVKIVHRTIGSNEIQKSHEQEIEVLNQAFGGKTLYMTKFNYILNYLDPFENYHFEMDELITLTGWPTLLPQYTRTLQSACESNDFYELFECAIRGVEETVIVFHERQDAEFLKEYLNQIHGIGVNFIPIKLNQKPKEHTPFWPYKIEHAVSAKD